jgi:hypothetical protein
MSWKKLYKYLIDALSQDGFVDDSSLQAAIDEAKGLANITKPISQSDIVDYSFLRGDKKIRPSSESLECRNYFIASAANEKSNIFSGGTASLIRRASRPISTISFIASPLNRPPSRTNGASSSYMRRAS